MRAGRVGDGPRSIGLETNPGAAATAGSTIVLGLRRICGAVDRQSRNDLPGELAGDRLGQHPGSVILCVRDAVLGHPTLAATVLKGQAVPHHVVAGGGLSFVDCILHQLHTDFCLGTSASLTPAIGTTAIALVDADHAVDEKLY